MKCISLWQPWATLIAIGAKRIETRDWETPYRGPILIHAAKKRSGGLVRMCSEEPFWTVLNKAQEGPWRDADKLFRLLPLGAIIAVADMIDCRAVYNTSVDCRDGKYHICAVLSSGQRVSGQELAFGDYAQGRFAWILTNVRRFPKPVPCVGRQQLFNVPDEMVAEQLAAAIPVSPAGGSS